MSARSGWRIPALVAAVFGLLVALHAPLLRLPYFWDEAGYYIPAALDFYRHAQLIPHDTVPSGHTPLLMIYIAAAWHLFGFQRWVTRAAMILVAAGAVAATFELGRRAAGRDAGVWSALLLALSPLFFAQSSLVYLDLAAALFTTLVVLFVLENRWILFAFAASAAVMTKETAVVLLPVAWCFLVFRRREKHVLVWAAAIIPLAPLAAWAIYYHHATGFWTGNAQYLQYNLYSTLAPLHTVRSLLARLAEIFVQGFNWIIAAGALAALWIGKRGSVAQTSRLRRSLRLFHKITTQAAESPTTGNSALPISGVPRGISQDDCAPGRPLFGDFTFLALGLIAVYIVMLSLVGGAVLPRYVLPALPGFYILGAALILRLPRPAARAICTAAAVCFIAAWFINPPYPFPYEDNLAYTDFIQLHQRAAKFLETMPGDPTILTAWPATDELRQPFLGYVKRPLRVVPVGSFTPADFRDPPAFTVLYLYSRKWEPRHNLFARLGALRMSLEHFFDYHPAVSPGVLAAKYRLRLIREFTRRGQWVRIYAKMGYTGALF